jgi:hypothetical protein
MTDSLSLQLVKGDFTGWPLILIFFFIQEGSYCSSVVFYSPDFITTMATPSNVAQ